MENILKVVHFEMFKIAKEQEKRMIFDSDNRDAIIRNDQTISCYREFDKILANIEKHILAELKG
jgi:hypothetical protein